jgi:uncharacterized Zn finger protein
MSRYNSRYDARDDDRWPAYIPVAERRRKAALAMEKLRKKGHPVAPVKIEGRAIVTTFWGKAWCDNLERYRDYENRIERGRTYVRNGSVVDLQIAPREVTAMVSGSELYQIKVSIGEVGTKLWASICKDCTGGINSLVELLQGRFSKGVMERICRQGDGLFPKPAEIRFSCSCPDHASMCKHVAAVLYGVGARLDARPELLFRLRAVDENDLIARIETALPQAKQVNPRKVLDTEDLSALFGLDMDAEPLATGGNPPTAPRKPARNPKAIRPDPSREVRQAAAVTGTRPATRMQAGTRAAIGRLTTAEPPLRSAVRPKAPATVNVATNTVTAKSARKTKSAVNAG